VNNLLDNAIKFSQYRDVSRIHITATVANGTTTIAITDNGVGFDQRYQDKLFTIFQRLHDEHEFPGNGIGLALSQRIIHRHEGQIEASSELNQGATFVVILPNALDS
jgi:light-regulated signal transduction histidine kinase (bacteriophytochrome)